MALKTYLCDKQVCGTEMIGTGADPRSHFHICILFPLNANKVGSTARETSLGVQSDSSNFQLIVHQPIRYLPVLQQDDFFLNFQQKAASQV